MDIRERNVSVRMVRENLENLPVHPVPEGFQVRLYRAGDEHNWVAVQKAAERHIQMSLDLFFKEFGSDIATLSQRQCFLCDPDNTPIGTASAWFDENHNGRPYGRIHWVAIVPEYQGRGLSKCLLSRACLRLRELGHDRAYLVTSTARVTAINLYMAFGFRPEILTEEDQAVWMEMKPYLKG